MTSRQCLSTHSRLDRLCGVSALQGYLYFTRFNDRVGVRVLVSENFLSADNSLTFVLVGRLHAVSCLLKYSPLLSFGSQLSRFYFNGIDMPVHLLRALF